MSALPRGRRPELRRGSRAAEPPRQGNVAGVTHECSVGILDPPGDGQHLPTVGPARRPFRRDELDQIVRLSERADELPAMPCVSSDLSKGRQRDFSQGPDLENGVLANGYRARLGAPWLGHVYSLGTGNRHGARLASFAVIGGDRRG